MNKHKVTARLLLAMAVIVGLASCNTAVGEYPHEPHDEVMSALLFIAGAVLLVGSAIVRALADVGRG